MSFSIMWCAVYRGTLILITWISAVDSISVNTPADFNYKNLASYGITGEGRTELFFTVQTCQDARIALFPYDPVIDGDTMYEIVFGGFNNLKHTIRTRKNDNNYLVSMTEMAGLLSCTEYKSFWITWKNFHIIAGTGQTIGSNVLLEYNDTRPDPFIVRYIGISTWYGVIGQWIFRNEIPTFSSLSSSTVYAKRGESVVLCCASVGIPVPVITWHRDGVNMSNFQDKYNITNSGYLTIHNFENMDSGLYICTATNSEGDNNFDVHVHCCDCCVWFEGNSTVLHQQDLNMKLQDIKETLYVDPKATALSKRRKISADDPRLSSMIVGMTCGVSVICTMVALLVCPDVFSLFRYILK